MILVIFLILIPFNLIGAEDTPHPRLITVIGESLIAVPANEIQFYLEIESTNNDVELAIASNKRGMKHLLKQVRKFDILEEDLKTGPIEIDRMREKFKPGDYYIKRPVLITLRNISKFEDLYSDLSVVSNYLNIDFSFRNTEIEKYKNETLARAIIAAKEKADLICEELGQRIRKPYTVKGVEINSYNTIDKYFNLSRQETARPVNLHNENTKENDSIIVKAVVKAVFEIE